MNFDEHIDRSLYPTMKWSKAFLAEHFGNEEALPMSVAARSAGSMTSSP